ncbi:MAG: dual OB domain-containing protein [Anaerolineae bacterium]
MATQEVLILAMTKMLSGICTAGFIPESTPVTGLRWVRPVRDFDTVLPGDMTDPDGHLIQCCDVVELELISARPDPPHVEDWLVDFVHRRPRRLRRLEGTKRADFFPRYLDQAPEEVLCRHKRSLALVEPMEVWARFSLDSYSGAYKARMGFTLDCEQQHPRAQSARGIAVTDLKWRALGRSWLGPEGGVLELDHDALLKQLEADALYLTVGLSRKYQDEYWPLVHAVHVIPDYDACVDLQCL